MQVYTQYTHILACAYHVINMLTCYGAVQHQRRKAFAGRISRIRSTCSSIYTVEKCNHIIHTMHAYSGFRSLFWISYRCAPLLMVLSPMTKQLTSTKNITNNSETAH
jgi:hypothetical protein